jgi:hypothetical protein
MKAEGVQPFANITFPNLLNDGDDNTVQLRCSDVAGNGPSVSTEYVIVVDTTPPTFSSVTPKSGEKQPGPLVTVAVEVRDAVVGLDTETVAYRWGTGGEDSLRDWAALTGESVVGAFYGSVELALLPGTDNVVQFRAADRLGNSAESGVYSVWVNRAPTAVIDLPVADVNYTEGQLVTFDGNGSSDPDGDELSYRWYLDGSNESLGDDARLEALVPVGIHNVTLRVEDTDGAWAEASVQVVVEALPSPEPKAGFPIAFLLILILVLVMAAVAVYYVKRQRFEEV